MRVYAAMSTDQPNLAPSACLRHLGADSVLMLQSETERERDTETEREKERESAIAKD